MVLVGQDGRDGGRDALELGRLLASALGSEVLEASVLVTGTSLRARGDLAHDGARTVVAPSVARGLSDVAKEVGACTVVIGSSHRGRVGRTLLGTGAEHLAELAPCPIAVAPRGYAQRYATRLRHIEVASNETPAAERAMALAGRIVASEPDGAVHKVGLDSLPDAEDDLVRRGADMLIVAGRARGHARLAHTCALMIV